MRKLYVSIGIALVIGAVFFLFGNQKQIAEQPKAESRHETTRSEPKTLGECMEAAELEYRVYMIMNNDGFEDINGTTVYNLSPAKIAEQNTKRADAIDVCFKSF